MSPFYGYNEPPVTEAGGKIRYNMIDCKYFMCCGVTVDNELKCWAGKHSPHWKFPVTTLVPEGKNWLSVDVGSNSICAIRIDNSLYCWSFTDANVAGMPTEKNFLAVSTGENGACAITLDGDITCFGKHGSDGVCFFFCFGGCINTYF